MAFLFRSRSAPGGPPEFLIAGLGNPGKKYETTRHNIGFLFLDRLADKYGFRIDRSKYDALTADVVIEGHRCIVMKPLTYMNNSGSAIEAAASFYRIPPENVIVIFDDIDIPFGDTRVKLKGSAGTHNGIKSIVAFLHSETFPRIKVGVGGKTHPEQELKDFVLSRFTPAELKTLEKAFDVCIDALVYLINGEADKAMMHCQIRTKRAAPEAE